MGDIEVKALNNISLDIGRHEFVAIIGASGSGKSTLMNIIGCLDTATSGTYELNQKDINSYSQTRLAEIRNEEIGFIFQGFNLLHKLDALHNTELPLIYKGVGYKKRMELSKKALADVGLGDRLHHRPNQLSGGQQQRVAIARALVTDPEHHTRRRAHRQPGFPFGYGSAEHIDGPAQKRSGHTAHHA